MLLEWVWIPLATLVLVAIYQQFRILPDPSRSQEERRTLPDRHRKRRRHDRLGRRQRTPSLQQSCLQKNPRILRRGTGETSAFKQVVTPTTASRCSTPPAKPAKPESASASNTASSTRMEAGACLNRSPARSATSKGEVAKLVIVNRDITERKRAEQQLEHNLFHDPLTGLPNRRLFLDRLPLFAHARHDSGRPYTLLLANIDHFKVFNESDRRCRAGHILGSRDVSPSICARMTRSRAAKLAP